MDEFYDAFLKLIEVKQEYQKAYDDYTGYDWGYHGYDYEQKVKCAKKKFKESFKNAVKEVLDSPKEVNFD